MRNIFFVVLSVMTIGCGNVDGTYTTIVGTVSEVRISSSDGQKSASNGDATGGAVIGALVAGTTGAIVGSAIGSESQTTVSGELLGCRITVQMTDGKMVTFNAQRTDNLTVPCSLLRVKDRVAFTKITSPQNTSYVWGNGLHRIYGEIVP